MKMKLKFDKIFWLEIMLFLLVVNYMVVVVLLNDNIVLKFLRDILLIGMILFYVVNTNRLALKKVQISFLLFLLILSITFLRTLISTDTSLSLNFTVYRKYVFSILLFMMVSNLASFDRNDVMRFSRYILYFFSFISLWGIFQAWILKDTFLMNIGYKTSYSYAYGTEMLSNSFYFGGLGIQRVVSTLSNSNVCGLILGISLIFLMYLYPYVNVRHKSVFYIIIMLGYILTFSRSNWIAAFIVSISIAYPYIPHKKKLLAIIGFILLIGVMLFFTQGESGIVYKIVNWINNSLSFKESSAAGRSSIWFNALQGIINNPLGVGFGKVGALARDAGITGFFASENSYLAVALDNGIIGLLIYLSCLVSVMRYFNKKAKENADNQFNVRICKAGTTIVLYYMIVSFFSNHIYDMEVTSIMFVYLGIAINMSCDTETMKI